MSRLACPFKPVAQRTVPVEEPHGHAYPVEIHLGGGLWVQDCTCGHRRRVQKGGYGDVVSVLDDAVVEGGTSLDNAVFLKGPGGQFVDRWQREVVSTH